MNEDSDTSADQDAWVSVWENLRRHLADMVPLIKAMKIDEIKTFADTLQAAQWGHVQALTMDKEVQLKLARATAD